MEMAITTKSLFAFLFFAILLLSSTLPLKEEETATSFKEIDVENHVIDATPSPLVQYSSNHIPKDALSCERIRVVGHSRSKLGSYANSFRVTMVPSAVIPEKLYGKIQICFHWNASLGLCDCEKDEWKAIQNGVWSSVMSPYDKKYVDVKFAGGVPGSVTISVEEDIQQWRLLCLALGFVLLLLAPIVCSWVPFYYSSSMAIGVFLVIIILLFQGMKLLPAGRKNAFYLTIYSSMIGAGSYLIHHISQLINAFLVNFGISEEMHNPVSLCLLVGVLLAGAALGYWVVRKFVISEDGDVDVGIAQFVKWAMRLIAFTLLYLSTLDTPLAIAALASCSGTCYLINSKLHDEQTHSYLDSRSHLFRKAKNATSQQKRAQFLSKQGKVGPRATLWNCPPRATLWNSPKSVSAVTKYPIQGLYSPTIAGGTSTAKQQDYYSTFHKTSKRKRFSKKEWEDFTSESTQQAMAEWASSPEFTKWVIENADRIKLRSENSSEESIGSGSDSTDDHAIQSGNRTSLFNW